MVMMEIVITRFVAMLFTINILCFDIAGIRLHYLRAIPLKVLTLRST